MPLIVAGERSGAGKTTVTLALLAALKSRGVSVQSFKVGPDYIDPMFHHYVTNRPSRNLDAVLTSEEYVRECFSKHTQDFTVEDTENSKTFLNSPKYALIEGVMGLFDGIKWKENKKDYGSTAHIARILDIPILFVIDCSRLSGSVAAIAHGYSTLDPRIKMAGVVLNRVGSDRHLELLKDALEELNLPVLGVLRRNEEITIPDRHLGLIPSEELPQLKIVVDKLAAIGNQNFNWEKLLPLLEIKPSDDIRLTQLDSSEFKKSEINYSELRDSSIKIAVARDKAFNFYYQDNLEFLQELGAEIIFWSPLKENMPPDVHGLYFGGGFPEVFAEQLSENRQALKAVKEAVLGGMPVYAECGGLMYLCEKIIDFEEKKWSGVGVIPANAIMGKRLTLGYRQCVALQDSPLLKKDVVVWGHEFHRSSLSFTQENKEKTPSFLFETRGISAQSKSELEGWGMPNLHASYVHLHWGATAELPQRFLQNCVKFREEK